MPSSEVPVGSSLLSVAKFNHFFVSSEGFDSFLGSSAAGSDVDVDVEVVVAVAVVAVLGVAEVLLFGCCCC